MCFAKGKETRNLIYKVSYLSTGLPFDVICDTSSLIAGIEGKQSKFEKHRENSPPLQRSGISQDKAHRDNLLHSMIPSAISGLLSGRRG